MGPRNGVPATQASRGAPRGDDQGRAAARRRTVFGNSISRCQTAHLVPAARFPRPEFATLLRSPESRGGRSAEKRSGAAAPVGPAHDAAGQALARRLASHDAGRSPLGAPPWRFWAPGAALLSPASASADASADFEQARHSFATAGICAGSVTASSSQPGRSAWRATSRASRGERLRSRHRGTPRLAPHSGSSLEHALNERGCQPSSIAPICSQV